MPWLQFMNVCPVAVINEATTNSEWTVSMRQGSSLNSPAETALPSWHHEIMGGHRWRRVRPWRWASQRAHAFSLQQHLTGETVLLREPWVMNPRKNQNQLNKFPQPAYILIKTHSPRDTLGNSRSSLCSHIFGSRLAKPCTVRFSLRSFNCSGGMPTMQTFTQTDMSHHNNNNNHHKPTRKNHNNNNNH